MSDSSLRYDRTTKLELYAKAGIKVYWVVNLIDRQVEEHTGPNSQGGKKPSFKKVRRFGAQSEVPLVIGGKELGRIPVKELLA